MPTEREEFQFADDPAVAAAMPTPEITKLRRMLGLPTMRSTASNSKEMVMLRMVSGQKLEPGCERCRALRQSRQ